jgi:hypothetical protein
MKKNLFIFISVWVFAFLIMAFNQETISIFLANILDILFTGFNSNSLSISFAEESSNVKTIIHNKFSEVPYYWINFDTKLHFIAPFSFLIGLLSSVNSKKKLLLSLISLIFFTLFYTFKVYLIVKDHTLRETFLANGEVVSVLKNPSFGELTIKSLNEILNTKAPIYTRYFVSLFIFISSFTYINGIKFSKLKLKNLF